MSGNDRAMPQAAALAGDAPSPAVSAVPAPAAIAAHTPGPWFVADGGVCAVECPADGSNVICCEPERLMRASLAKWPDNARLIAAAPALYSVVVDMFENPDFQVSIGSNPHRIDELMGRARAAVSLARGAA